MRTATPHATRVSRSASITCRVRSPSDSLVNVSESSSSCGEDLQEYLLNATMMMEPKMSGHSLQSLDHKPGMQMHTQHQQGQWTHDVSNESIPQQHSINNPTIVTDEIRFAIIDAVWQRTGIWDSQREKTVGPSRKELFGDVTHYINTHHNVELTSEEVEKQWKNLKDTYIKTRKKAQVVCDSEGRIVTSQPKWKFFAVLAFLEELYHPRGTKRRSDEGVVPINTPLLQPVVSPHVKRVREDDPDTDDDYMGFCRSLVYPMREIGYKDRVQVLKLQKAIRDLVHETHIEVLINNNQHHNMR